MSATGDPRFHALLADIAALHDRKQRDYGVDEDPLRNVRASQEWGIPPWVGALVRLNDKVIRLQAFARKGELANESVEDSMLDIAVYALLSLILYREDTPPPPGRPDEPCGIPGLGAHPANGRPGVPDDPALDARR